MNRLAEDYAVKVAKLPDRIAAIVGRTRAERGDAFELADDEAVGMIRDLLLELNPTVLESKKTLRLA